MYHLNHRNQKKNFPSPQNGEKPHFSGRKLVQACAPSFSEKIFEILDLGSSINDISHYGARTFEYNLALR